VAKQRRTGRGTPLFRFFYKTGGVPMSISLNTVGQTMATDGRNVSSTRTEITKPEEKPLLITTEPGIVAKKLAENSNDLEESIRVLQRLSDKMDRKVQFNVNNELGRVVVKIVDPATDKVIKEIPSADIQKLQIRIKETLGLLFDKQI
jgi:flagellar protein FlaG